MGGAITVSVNNTTSQQIRRLWNEVSSFEDGPSMEKLCYPPHFTFAIYEKIEMELLAQTVRRVFEKQEPLSVSFESIGHFDVSPMVLWASPGNASRLLELHNEIHSLIDPAGCHEHYRPASWVPHCTLGTGIQDPFRDDALAFAARVKLPFEVVFDRADWIAFPPVETVGTHELGSDKNS